MTALSADFHPFMVLLEDDFELSHHPSVWSGCFCDLHLKLFAEQEDRAYTREELPGKIQRGDGELRGLQGSLSRNTLVEFAREFLNAVDRVSPYLFFWP